MSEAKKQAFKDILIDMIITNEFSTQDEYLKSINRSNLFGKLFDLPQ